MAQETAVWRRKFQLVSQSLLTQDRQREKTAKCFHETLSTFYHIGHTESKPTYRNNQVGYAL